MDSSLTVNPNLEYPNFGYDEESGAHGMQPSAFHIGTNRSRPSPHRMSEHFQAIFKQDGTDPARAKLLSRVFGIFSEEIVRIWATDERAPYACMGRPTIKSTDSGKGYTLDFALRSRTTGHVYVTEMKCEIEYQNFRYFVLDGAEQLTHHNKPAFKEFLDSARCTPSQAITVNGEPVATHGAILIWGATTPKGKRAVMESTGIHDVLSVADICHDLAAWGNAEYHDLLTTRSMWCSELFSGLAFNGKAGTKVATYTAGGQTAMYDDDTLQLFDSVDSMHESNRRDTLDICSRNGFTIVPTADGRLLTCSVQGQSETIEVLKNGAWEYRNTSPDAPVVTSGMSAVFLKYFFHARDLYISANPN